MMLQRRMARPGVLRHGLLALTGGWLVLSSNLQASASDETLAKQLAAAKLFQKRTTYRFLRNGGQLVIELSHYPASDERTQKIDALLIARTVMHAEPGSIDSVITRFLKGSSPGSYIDIMISNRQIVGADAGIMDSTELLSGIETVSISTGDSAESRSAKYCIAARHELAKKDLREAEHLFSQAFKESPEATRKDSNYTEGMVRLAKAYEGRDDVEYQARVYKSLMASLPTSASPESLNAMRDMYTYYAAKDDWTSAETVAKTIVDLEKNAGAGESSQCASDLQLLAASRRKQGHVAEAKSDYEQALALKTKLLGENHPAVADALEGIGDCFKDEKDSAKANDYYNRSKLVYDRAMVAKNSKDRISYDTYRSIIVRLKEKMAENARARKATP